MPVDWKSCTSGCFRDQKANIRYYCYLHCYYDNIDILTIQNLFILHLYEVPGELFLPRTVVLFFLFLLLWLLGLFDGIIFGAGF